MIAHSARTKLRPCTHNASTAYSTCPTTRRGRHFTQVLLDDSQASSFAFVAIDKQTTVYNHSIMFSRSATRPRSGIRRISIYIDISLRQYRSLLGMCFSSTLIPPFFVHNEKDHRILSADARPNSGCCHTTNHDIFRNCERTQ